MIVNSNKDKSSYKAPAIGRAITLLEHLSTCKEPPTLSELSRTLGLGKSTTLGI
jgi:DNA-binding IclR family transcriptional regulator